MLAAAAAKDEARRQADLYYGQTNRAGQRVARSRNTSSNDAETGGAIRLMKNHTGARWEITVDGKPRSYLFP